MSNSGSMLFAEKPAWLVLANDRAPAFRSVSRDAHFE
jgi:hypothetical protein